MRCRRISSLGVVVVVVVVVTVIVFCQSSCIMGVVVVTVIVFCQSSCIMMFVGIRNYLENNAPQTEANQTLFPCVFHLFHSTTVLNKYCIFLCDYIYIPAFFRAL